MGDTPTPAAPERDLFSLALSRNMGTLTEEFDHAMDHDVYEGEQAVPPRVLQISDLVMCEAVRLIRQGKRDEIAEAGVVISHSVLHRATTLEEEGRTLENPFDEAFSNQKTASKVLGVAIAPSSAGSELMVLRSMNGLSAKVFCYLVDSGGFKDEDRRDPSFFRGAELARAMGLKDDKVVHMALCELSSAGLVSHNPAYGFIFGGRQSQEGEVDEAMAIARAYAEAYDRANEN